MKKIVFYVVAFGSNKIQACQAHQNDRLKLIFVKDINIVGQKMTREGRKMTNPQICLFFYTSDYKSQIVTKFNVTKSRLHCTCTVLNIFSIYLIEPYNFKISSPTNETYRIYNRDSSVISIISTCIINRVSILLDF